MEITRRDIGYTLYSRLEEALRTWLARRLWDYDGPQWIDQIPPAVLSAIQEKASTGVVGDLQLDPASLLEETEIPQLKEVICFRKSFQRFIQSGVDQDEFIHRMDDLYQIRCKIAHVKRTFTTLDLDSLREIADRFLGFLGTDGVALKETLECIQTNPQRVIIRIPSDFLIAGDAGFKHPNNLPASDYDPDGGFIGRREDRAKVEALLLGNVHRVITIGGAGGVGKTALAHQICQKLLGERDLPFDGVVWVSAKEEQLTVSGIEPVVPTLKNFESLLNAILETFDWTETLEKSIKEKKEDVEIIFRAGAKGVLLVIDNLETMSDEQVRDLLKDLPPPNKVLITSRIGLGEVERRYVLKEMTPPDAVALLRTVAREKGAESLARLPDPLLKKYVDKMWRYPLAIKWVVGQVALGKDMDTALAGLTDPQGDVTRFCFEHIFEKLLNDETRAVLYSLAAYDKPLAKGVLAHVTDLSTEVLDAALQALTIASLVIPSQVKTSESSIETRYELLPLTRDYLHSKLRARPDIFQSIKKRVGDVQALIEEADRAGRYYRYSLSDMGAETEEEKIAAFLALSAYHRFQSGDYDGAITLFQRAAQVAPRFAMVYRNWAATESQAGFHEKADELIKKSVSLAPEDSRLWFFWGNMEKERQRYDSAAQYLRKALELSPNDGPILGALGEVEKRRGYHEKAEQLLLKALEDKRAGRSRRHTIVCSTSLTDNLLRWAVILRKEGQKEEAFRKVRQAYNVSSGVLKSGTDDFLAFEKFREASLSLGISLLEGEGFGAARRYLEDAISSEPRRGKEKKTNEVACYYLARELVRSGQVEGARKYYVLGKRWLRPGGSFVEKYEDLAVEFERISGKLHTIMSGKGYGFLQIGDQLNLIFVHHSDIMPRVSLEEFEQLKGRVFSFVIEETPRGLKASRVYCLNEAIEASSKQVSAGGSVTP